MLQNSAFLLLIYSNVTSILKRSHVTCVYTRFHELSLIILYAATVQRPSIKYVTLKGERGSEKVCHFVTGGGGQEHVTSRLYKFVSYIRNMKFKVMFNFLL